MSKIKVIVGFIMCAGLAAGLYCAFALPSKQAKCARALECLIEGNYRGAETLIDALPPPFPVAFYKGHLLTAQGKFSDADASYKKAFAVAKEPALRAEILLSQAMNAFFTAPGRDLTIFIDSAKRLAPRIPQLPLFEGISFYVYKDYAKALEAFSNYLPPKEESWLGALIETRLPFPWVQIHRAHCLIEQGDFTSAREILEHERHYLSAKNEYLHPLCTLFLGLTYLEEAHTLPLEEQQSCFKLAHFYFQQSEKEGHFPLERERIVPFIQKVVSPTSGLPFIAILEQWQATEALGAIADRFVEVLIQEKDPDLCQAIYKECQGTPFHDLLTTKLTHTICLRLRNGEIDDLVGLWRTAQALAPTSASLKNCITSLTADEMYQTIDKDTYDLPRTRAYLSFWTHVEKNPTRRSELAWGLIKQGELFWKKEGQESKGTQLFDFALKIGDETDRKGFKREIERFFSALYAFAESTNMVGRLALIFDTLEHFSISTAHLASPEIIANHLADAAYHFKAHNFASAYTHATWVLKLAPKNTDALRLYGLSAFQLGSFSRAAIALGQLPNPDEMTKRALMLSIAFSSKDPDQHLAHMDATDPFDEE